MCHSPALFNPRSSSVTTPTLSRGRVTLSFGRNPAHPGVAIKTFVFSGRSHVVCTPIGWRHRCKASDGIFCPDASGPGKMAMASSGAVSERTESSAVTFDRLRWWIVAVAIGAAAMACVSLSADVSADLGADTDTAPIQAPASLH